MYARIASKLIVVRGASSYTDLRDVIDGINQVLLPRGYRLAYFFEGTPVLGGEGFSVIVKLDRALGDAERKAILRILVNRRIVVEEDEL